MPRTLYRAAARATIAPATFGRATFGRGACFAESLADAERYTRNPGFGGEHLFSFDVEAEYVCHDLYGVTLDELTGRAPLPPPERKDT